MTLILLRPKFEANVAMVVRLAAAYGIRRVVQVEPRYAPNEDRTPREIRMFREVELITGHHPPAWCRSLVAVERREASESLVDFVHPPGEGIGYVFGPEDGDIDQGTLRQCSRFVQIPVQCSLNLATAVATVLWDRKVKG